VNTTLIHYNVRDAAGRAITHVLEKSALAGRAGLEVRDVGGGGRTLIVHPQLSAVVSEGEASLLLAIESIAGQGNVNIFWLLDGIDEPSRRAIAEAVFIASGFEYRQVAS
jgi:hypothetical protein